ncbi:MAG: transglutaminaseTgpA domain-containing protein [Acidobacteria bacterium]|nr:transglutaminaseTgpA domain-containing protein [Acidobacteriota bacterium]
MKTLTQFNRIILIALLWCGWASALGSDALAGRDLALVGAMLAGASLLKWRLGVGLLALGGLVVGAFFSGGPLYLAWALLFVILAVLALMGGQIPAGGQLPRGAVWRLVTLAFSMTFGIVLLGGLLFFLLPRTARTAYQHFAPRQMLVGGFGNQVLLGRLADIKRRTTPVLHVRAFDSDGRVPPLKWRGTALREFDGRRWWSPPERGRALYPEQGLIRVADDAQRWRAGKRFAYEVHQQYVAADVLFIAGTPEFVQTSVVPLWRTSEGALRTGLANQDGVRFGVNSFLNGALLEVPPLGAETRLEYLKLPPLDPRVIALARQLKTPAAIENYLRTQFAYTLDGVGSPVDDPLAHFLFERRAGHCEYFASAMAAMLRAVDVPSRVITGFQGGEFNPYSKWTVLRASDAHAWVEAFIEGRGWVTFDPTPADPNPVPVTWSWMYMDALDTYWRDWVLSYTLDQQLTLAARLDGWRLDFSTEWAGRAPWMALGAGGAIAAMLLLWRMLPAWKRRRQPETEAARLYAEMLGQLRRRGVEKPAWMTPAEFAAHLPDTAWRPAALQITELYTGMRWSRERPGAGPAIRQLLKQL